MGDARPVTWARRRALDAVMAWVRDRERNSPPILGPEREYVEGVTGVTTISGAGKVYASEAVDRMERLLVELKVPELAAALRDTLNAMLAWADEWGPGMKEKHERYRALLAQIEELARGGDRG